VRAGPTLAVGLLLLAILVAAVVQFVFLAR
jgi:hypothetical protein